MQHIPRLFTTSKRGKSMDPKKNPRKPRLERRNALKYIDYYAAASSSSSSLDSPSPSSSSSSSFLVTRSLDLSDKTSFRIEGTDGELEQICGLLGLSGPEDFGIPVAAWEARKVRSSSDLHPRSRLHPLDSPDSWDREVLEAAANDLCKKVENVLVVTRSEPVELAESSSCIVAKSSGSFAAGGGIKGLRPPLLKPPPAMRLPEVDHTSSTWDIFRDFAPEGHFRKPIEESSSSEEEEEVEEEEEEEEDEVEVVEEQEEVSEARLVVDNKAAMSETGSFTTTNDDDSSSSTTEPSNISPNVRFRRNISSWQKGALLGRGSFGSVYEGIADDGFFFAVKEVSLLDQGDQGKQSIYQLEQEIFLLSQFEHENIVQYLGTDKDDSKLYIFLELVTQGSLQKLYHSYNLDSQVSSYTRQILHGLKYLHDQNVVHRDIKCANILVGADGSVKLSDFGLAKATKFNDVRSCKGTACWMAPEVVNRKSQGYGLPADIWSLGCTVLEMLTRKIPYSELEWMTALYKIGKGTLPTVPESLSTEARDFIMSCLKVDPNLRCTAAQLLQHPFVNRLLPTSSASASPNVSGPRSSST